MESIKKMYLSDKKELESKEIYNNYHRDEFDILDRCYGYNQRLLMENLSEKYRLYMNLQRQTKPVICANINVSFNTIVDWIDCRKPDHLFATLCAIENLSVHQRVPMSLLNIAAAASVKMFNNDSVESDLLLAIFNVVKEKEISIRCGVDHERMIYNFANIIKNFIYKKKNLNLLCQLNILKMLL